MIHSLRLLLQKNRTYRLPSNIVDVIQFTQALPPVQQVYLLSYTFCFRVEERTFFVMDT